MISTNDNIVYGLTCILDDRVPAGSFGIITNGALSVHTENEYLKIMENIPPEELIIIGGGEDE